MRNIRREVQVVSRLCETILQWRLEHSESLGQRLKTVRKKIRTMRDHNVFEEGIVEMLDSRESFQIKEKLMKALQEEEDNEEPLMIQIHITSSRKRDCEIYNEELWHFGIFLEQENKENKGDSTEGIVHLIEHVLKHLEFSTLLPLHKDQKNRFIINYKVSLAKPHKLLPIQFENLSTFEAVVTRDNGISPRRLTSKFYYNDSKVEESLKEMIMERSLEHSGISKKNSTGSTQGSIRISFYEHYDEELDVTVLSNEEILENYEDLEDDDDEFQILMEETVSRDDIFLNENASLFEKLSSLNSP